MPAPRRDGGGPADGATGGRRRRRRRRWPLLLLLVPLLLLLAGALWANWTYSKIDQIDLEAVLDPVSGPAVNYLLVGSDSRDELDPEGSSGVTGRRSDTIILLRTTPEGSSMMSIPRDLWVTIADSGADGRINGAYNSGPANLVRTVKDNLDVPVNHYVEIGFASFVGLVDTLGGVAIEVPHPAVDRASGLVIEGSGEVTLDGTQALAYARSRNYTEIIDGREVLEPTADLGRQQRQQYFLRTVLADVGSTRNPATLVRVADSMSSQLTVDSGLGLLEATRLVRKLSSSDPESVTLPTEGARRGGASVLVMIQPDAQEVLRRFR
jgi:LCP family protein required for cell wall assembly